MFAFLLIDIFTLVMSWRMAAWDGSKERSSVLGYHVALISSAVKNGNQTLQGE